MSNKGSRKDFKAGTGWIGVHVFDDGTVYVGATGTITIEEFARLASSVIGEHNTKLNAWQGFPNCNDLVDLADLSDCVEPADAGGGTHCPDCGTELAEPGPCWVCSDPLDSEGDAMELDRAHSKLCSDVWHGNDPADKDDGTHCSDCGSELVTIPGPCWVCRAPNDLADASDVTYCNDCGHKIIGGSICMVCKEPAETDNCSHWADCGHLLENPNSPCWVCNESPWCAGCGHQLSRHAGNWICDHCNGSEG